MSAPIAPSAGVVTSPIGTMRDSEEFRTSSHRLAQFARAVDDVNPHHLVGEFASPVFNHIPVMQSMIEVLDRVTAGSFVMHGEHDFIFHAPIRPADRLFTTSTLSGMRGTQAGMTFIVRSQTMTHDGKEICTQYSTCLVRGDASSVLHGTAQPERPVIARNEATSSTYLLTADQTRRYADAARDYSAYTMDPAAAAKVGFPAPLVHGMLSLALAARAIVDERCGGQTPRLMRLGCRFSHPLLLVPGQTVMVDHWAGDNGLVGFEARDAQGNTVIKNGYAEVSS